MAADAVLSHPAGEEGEAVIDANGQNGKPQPASNGGLGGHSERTESGLTAIHDQRMLATALKRGWFKGVRWATDATADELAERNKNATAKDLALQSAIRGLTCGDGRVEQRAVSNVIAMERQNQADEAPESSTNVQVNVGLQIETHKDWYNNDAHDKSARSLAAPDTDSDGPTPIQAGGLRPEIRKNGNGTNGSH